MWRRWQMKFNWRRRAPLIASLLLAGLTAADVAHIVWDLRTLARAQALPPIVVEPVRNAAIDPEQILQAHLFGESKTAVAAVDPAHAPETQLALTLHGVLATDDPHSGYAILGAVDKPTHMYRIGATLEDVPEGRLQEVFVDRVVLDLNGKLETLRLPHQNLFGGEPRQTAGEETAVAENSASATPDKSPDVITPAQGWFANLNIEQTNVESGGLLMHPGKRFQREYGFKDSDVLTAVDGVEITDADTLASTLKTNAKSLSLTFVRDGVPHTVKLPVSY